VVDDTKDRQTPLLDKMVDLDEHTCRAGVEVRRTLQLAVPTNPFSGDNAPVADRPGTKPLCVKWLCLGRVERGR
jgi:hypothetical protein